MRDGVYLGGVRTNATGFKEITEERNTGGMELAFFCLHE